MLTWSQLLGLLEAGNYTELTIGEAPYLDYLLDINIDRFRFPESTPGRNMAGNDSGNEISQYLCQGGNPNKGFHQLQVQCSFLPLINPKAGSR